MTDTRRCYIHVGLPKTGTSYVQSTLRASRAALRSQGLDLLPRGDVVVQHFHVALFGSLDTAMDPPKAFRALDRLRQQAVEWDGDRALISQEVLGGATRSQAAHLLSLVDDYEPHVIVTVRDPSRALPSAWQQSVQGRGLDSFEAFLDQLEEEAARHEAKRWRRHLLHTVLDTWQTQVPPERIHVVTVPPAAAGTDVLMKRFCQVLGVDAGTLAADVSRSNPSLGLVQAELLRRVNVALGDELPHRRAGFREHGRNFLARRILLQQAGPPPRLPSSRQRWCTELAESMISRLATGGYDVVGDLEEIRPAASNFVADAVVTEAELVDAAAEALAAVLVDRHRTATAGSADLPTNQAGAASGQPERRG